ncbi:caspase Dronc-like [Strongylocentrotus purpuratus]|uniref:Caspase family p10 domain-containing protein n=1 Tax=Strongylocentrotus purpuratus TaxID=7668 RepID=A0A7M7ND36_STRPU|nr:caspase Dronc-like [Strongylocentrotus purpuratus]
MKYMKGKPKMIFFQGNREKAKEETEADIDMEISDASDLLVVHSTTSGNVPDRSVIRGSRFIQMLCKELLKNAHVSDLSTMLEQVTRKVGKKTFNHKYDKTPEVIKQGISKKIYFLPKYPPEENE